MSSMIKNSIKMFAGFCLNNFFPGILLPRGNTVILMYHRVTSIGADNIIDNSLFISCKSFEKNILFLLRNNFNIIGLNDWLRFRKKDKKYCIITFDDGWRDNYDNAFPVLKKYGIPATIFLTTSFIDSSTQLWFDELNDIMIYIYNKRSIDKLKLFLMRYGFIFPERSFQHVHLLYSSLVEKLKEYNINIINEFIAEINKKFKIDLKKQRTSLTWNEIEMMSAQNVTFGSHGVYHHIIPNLTPTEKKYEIFSSKKILEKKKINFVPIFSCPNGLMDQDTVNMIFDAGYVSIFLASAENKINYSPLIFSRICTSEYLCGDDDKFAMRLFLARLRGEHV